MSNRHRRNRRKPATCRKADARALELFQADRVAIRKGGKLSHLGRDLAALAVRRRQRHG